MISKFQNNLIIEIKGHAFVFSTKRPFFKHGYTEKALLPNKKYGKIKKIIK